MVRSIGKALGTSIVGELKERGLSSSDLDSDDRKFKRSLDGLSTPKEVVKSFVEYNWDYPAMLKVIDRAYRKKLITRSQLRELAGEAYLKRDDFDT